jgi:hypothetical protein
VAKKFYQMRSSAPKDGWARVSEQERGFRMPSLTEIKADRPITNYLTILSQEKQGSMIGQFPAIYIDGYGNLSSDAAKMLLTEDEIYLFIGAIETPDEWAIRGGKLAIVEIGYDAIRSLTTLEQREITALRTFLIGPLLAAWLKKKTRCIAIGFQDELGLIQTPTLAMDETDINRTYEIILRLVRKKRQTRTLVERRKSDARDTS